MNKLRVLFVTSEAYPLVKTGGLGDVCYSLPNALRQLDVDVRLLLPGYSSVIERLSLVEVHDSINIYPLLEPIRLLVGIMPGEVTPVYVIDCPSLYQRDGGPYQDITGKDWEDNAIRFGVLSKVAALFGEHHFLFKPQIIHSNDWQTAMVPMWLAFSNRPYAKTIMSVHNMAYQGLFGPETVERIGLPPESFSMFGLEFYGKVSFLKAGIYYANQVTTVSPNYAKDIQTKAYGCGLDILLKERQKQLTGIVNGIDLEVWNPETDTHLNRNYNTTNLSAKVRNTQVLRTQLNLATSKKMPLIGMITRLTEQKGMDLVIPIIPMLIKAGVQIAILGSGDKTLEMHLQRLAAMYPKQMSVTIGYDEELSHQIEAGANIFLMPSKFEPCGLNQMYSMSYGTIPIVRHTGGLADTVIDATPENIKNKLATGFIFERANANELLYCVQRAVKMFSNKPVWKQLQITGMTRDFSWQKSAKQYVSLYHHSINTI
ncbi:MAG: glycogen synthase GlgA [Proteobacteria bacterium]|nr:glycogen synthase GlgA [Pseudomonadota bacterium]